MNRSQLLQKLGLSKPTLDWERSFTDALPRVFNYILYKVGDRTLAEDLTAETFERAWKCRATYRPDQASPTTWFLGIARHVVASDFRQAERGVEVELSADLAADDALEQLVEKQLAAERLHALLHQLSDRERELISMKYGAGLNNREIAALTSLSESNVGTILQRVVQKLRTQWEVKR